MLTTSPPFTSHFATLAPAYDVLLCDVWGVVHNGVAAALDSCDALARFRARGGTVVLITNAPRPGAVVKRNTLDPLGVPPAAYDGIVSSGDVTRAVIAARACEQVFHIGPARDLPMFEGLDARVAPLERRLAAMTDTFGWRLTAPLRALNALRRGDATRRERDEPRRARPRTG